MERFWSYLVIVAAILTAELIVTLFWHRRKDGNV
jgi:hypothetical protein